VTLLLDTHALVWWHQTGGELGPIARERIRATATRPWISVASVWEAAIKHASGRLRLPKPPHDLLSDGAIQGEGFQVLAIGTSHAIAAAALPRHHGDPFDRMLIAQAQVEGLTIVTSDPEFAAYDVGVLDARR